MNLKKIRNQIDKIDTKIVKAFEQRMTIVDKVATYKIENNMEILDSSREKAVIDRAVYKTDNEYLKPYIPYLYSTVMSISKQHQRNLIQKHNATSTINASPAIDNAKVGYLGIEGSFSYQALKEYFTDATTYAYASFEQVLDSVLSGTIDYAIVPVENTSTGNVDTSIDLLADRNVWILDEYIIKIEHCLLGIKGAKETDIKKVYSHHQGIGQCREYLFNNNIAYSIEPSTAHGAQLVQKENNLEHGAIASKLCAKIYNLNVLKENINTNHHNYTRFVVVSKKQKVLPNANKISIVATINHRAGALYDLVGLFAEHKINLLKIVSRPIANNPWEYNFHLDFTGNIDDASIKQVLAAADKICVKVKLLGCYSAYERQD